MHLAAIGDVVPVSVTSCIVLVDRQALRRMWVAQSLGGWGLAGEIVAVARAAEIAGQPADGSVRIDLAIVNAGAGSVLDGPVAEDVTWLRTHLPEVPVAIMADRDEPGCVRAALKAGVRCYVPTSTDQEVARKALALVLAGGCYAPPAALLEEEEQGAAATGATRGSAGPEILLSGRGALQLTPRQREVLTLLGEGRPNKVIAKRLDMCESTVKVHVRQIMRKFGATNRTEVALRMRELLPGGTTA